MKAIKIRVFGIALAVLMLLVSNTVFAEFSNEGVIHTVFLWLKKPGASDRLRSIEGVLDIRFGEMIESNRDIVDDSFDVGIYFYFSDVAAMNLYLVHPLHQEIVEQDIKPLVERIVVHDFRHTVIR